jgi:hypothetical protein
MYYHIIDLSCDVVVPLKTYGIFRYTAKKITGINCEISFRLQRQWMIYLGTSGSEVLYDNIINLLKLKIKKEYYVLLKALSQASSMLCKCKLWQRANKFNNSECNKLKK